MIDLHCHMLPGIDDGAPDLATSLAMAKAFVADGVTVVACTPHILPAVYPNTGPDIQARVDALQVHLNEAGVSLQLVAGADNHIVPNMVAGLRSGHLLTLAGSRYVLVEPPHHVAPPRLEEFFFDLVVAGFVPILTHPERLSWIKSHYPTIQRLAQSGTWMQITAGSLLGGFGKSPQYWAERMLDEGIVHILATDSHNTQHRPPNLSAGRRQAEKRVGPVESENLVVKRPYGIIHSEVASQLWPPPRVAGRVESESENAHGRSTAGPPKSADAADDRLGGRRTGGIAERLRRIFGQ